MPNMMWKISQMFKMSKGDHGTPTSTESMTGPHKSQFMQEITQDIKELEQQDNWARVYRN